MNIMTSGIKEDKEVGRLYDIGRMVLVSYQTGFLNAARAVIV